MADKFICGQVCLHQSSFFLPADEGAYMGDGQMMMMTGGDGKKVVKSVCLQGWPHKPVGQPGGLIRRGPIR